MTISISAVVPTRGRGAHLLPALRSALAELPDGGELLVVHDRRAGEAALERPLDDPRVVVVEAAGPGVSAARNTGLDRARGELVALLDDDDLWLPGHLATTAAALRDDPGAVLVATDALLLDDPEGSRPEPHDPSVLPRFLGLPAARSVDLGELLARNPILTPTVVLRRGLLAAEDRFDPALRAMEDYDLWLRLAGRHRLLLLDSARVVVRRRRDSASGAHRAMAEGGLAALARIDRRGLPPALRRQLARREGRLWQDLAWACLVEEDLPRARRAALAAIRRLPLRFKSFIYLLATRVPAPARRALLARRRRVSPPDRHTR
jgi:glycosyltransferase involved in cell wall biosynthesis